MKRLLQLLKFVFVGFGNAIIDLGVFNGLYFMFPTHNVKRLVLYNTLAVGAAIFNSYMWNSRWTFRQERKTRGPEAMRQRVLFLIQSLINIVVNDLILGIIAPLIADTHLVDHFIANNLAKLLAMFFASLTSFLMMKLVVFA